MNKREYIFSPIPFSIAVGYVALYLGLVIFPILQPYYFAWIPTVLKSNPHIQSILVFLPLVILAILAYGKDVRQSWYEYKDFFWRSTLLVIVTYVFVTVMTNAIMDYLHVSTTINEERLHDYWSPSSIIWSIIFFGLFGPFVEEIVFRHILIGKFSNGLPLWFVTVVSVFLFVYLHIHVWNEAYVYLPMSLALTAVYIGFGKSIAHSYALHMLNNILVVLVSSY